MLYIVLFIIYFCFVSCVFYHNDSEDISPQQTQQFYDQVSQLMKDDIEPSLTQSKISAPETITKPETLSYKELMKIPYHTLKSVASYKNIALQNIQNKSQLCSKLKFVLTQQELTQYL